MEATSLLEVQRIRLLRARSQTLIWGPLPFIRRKLEGGGSERAQKGASKGLQGALQGGLQGGLQGAG